MKNQRFWLSAASVAALVTGSAVARAQVQGSEAAQSAAPTEPTAQPDDAAADDRANREIVVTGSRISRAGFQAPTPVTVVSTDDLIRKQPSSLADALYQLPAFQNSVNGNQQQFTQANRQRTGNYLNLRALGTQRVLVLQDGMRMPPSGINGGVDASLIPQLLTNRIDIVTGGASAAYGSDAVSGVVNFIIDKRFKGLKAQAQRGIADGGYAGSYRIGVAGGTSLLDDRLHIIASAERFHTDSMLKSTFPSIDAAWTFAGTGTPTDPFRYLNDVRFSAQNDAGVITSGPLARRQFAPDGSVIPYNAGLPAGIAGRQIGGDGGKRSSTCCTIAPSTTQTQFFARAEYEFSDSLTAFASAGLNYSTANDAPSHLGEATVQIFRGNAFLRPEVAATIFGTGTSFTMGKQDSTVAPLKVKQTSDSKIFNAGLEGKLGESLKWQASYTYGRTFFQSKAEDMLTQHFYAATDAVRDSGGNIVCRVTTTNPGLYPGCVPINLFGAGNISREARNYIYGVSYWDTVNVLNSGQASISGDLFDFGAGPVAFAVGGEIRKQTLNLTSNSDPAIPTDFTGLRGVQAASSLKFSSLNQGIAKGHYTVKEVFGELDVPVLKDSAVGSLSLNGAARLTDYSTSGTVTTWKLGAIYDPIPALRFRATLSRDIRAPTLYELFAGETTTAITFLDRLTNQSANALQVSGGNANLTPEIAKSFTGGFVFHPEFIPGLNFSADYFKIKIDDAIGVPFSAFQIVDLCAASNFTSPLCSQVVRPISPTDTSPANFPSRILTSNQNLSSVSISGIDFELRYARQVPGGRLNLSALGTRQITFKQTNAPGQPTLEFVGTADLSDAQFPVPQPKWRGTFSVGYETGPVSLSVQERVIGGYKRSKLLSYVENDIGPVWYTDASLVVGIPHGDRGKFEFFATVNNLFDRDPPLIPLSRTPALSVPTIRNAYDIIGRYITVGARVRF